MTDNSLSEYRADQMAMGEDEVGDFEFGDFGTIPELSKEDYNGKVIVVVGVSEQTFDGEYQTPARSLLHYMPDEVQTGNTFGPWGLLLGAESPAITNAQGQLAKNGGKPFYARILKKQGKTYPYWNIEPVRKVFNQDGTIGGFRTREGVIIDNTEAALPMPERQERKHK